jgi:2-keto-4-pentenoate hydratase/2-oxohepta-3-ene-1,7-dioic acid hydratase in catechol pathway
MYYHRSIENNPIDLPVGKVVCVGANYHDHIKEMQSVVNDEAVLFMKPTTALASLQYDVLIPCDQGECHNEAELVFLISEKLTKVDEETALNAISGVAIGLDLTLRDVQKQLKALGRPWERAKAFDGAAVVSPFISAEKFNNLQDIHFSLSVNCELRQQGHSKMMIRTVAQLVSLISQQFTLLPGDVVFTGTPAGVAALQNHDELTLTLENTTFTTRVVTR